jgi:hypothetical protein
MSFRNLTISNLMRLFFSKLIFLFEVEIFWILSRMHLHPGTVVPAYTACLHKVLNVLSCVAFTLLVQNYLCTNLPTIYTVVQKAYVLYSINFY